MVNEPEKYHQPPRKLLQLLRWFCADHFLEEIEGDLFEYFQEEVEIYGVKRAKRRFAGLMIRYLKPYFFDKNHLIVNLLITTEMILHFAKIALRQLSRQKFYALTNILGFGVGLAVCLLIGLFVQHELNYDQYHEYADELYRVSIKYNADGNSGHTAVMSPPMAKALKNTIPEVVESCRMAPGMYDAGSNQVRPVDQKSNSYEEGFCYADPSFLEMFDLKFVHGTANEQLAEPYTMMLTERKARQLFGNSNPIGESLILNDREASTYRITGVLADLPNNTHLQFDYLLAMESTSASKQDNWNFNNFLTYVQLAPGADVKTVEDKIRDVIINSQSSWSEALENDAILNPILQAVPDIHLQTSDTYGYWQHGNGQYVSLFGVIALFILLLASINFINLSTARARLRGLEIGLRKVLGSVRQQLVAQFLVESVLVSVLALLLAVTLAIVSMPFFNTLTERQLGLPWGQWWWYIGLLTAPLVLGLLVGSYPALYLSGYKPLQVLQGYLSRGGNARKFRSQLVVFQFTIAVALIAGSLAVKHQLDFLQQQELGFNKEQVLIVEGSHILRDQAKVFKENLQQLSVVKQVSMGGYLPVEGYFRNGCGTWVTGQSPDENERGLQKWYVDYDYLETMGMELVAGRGFSENFATDSLAIILNETAVKEMELEDPIGKRISSYTYMDSKTGELYHKDYVLIGVVKDFHYESLRKDIGGLSMVMGGGSVNTMIRYEGHNSEAIIAEVSKQWERLAPGQPLRYNFLDDRYAKMYAFEDRVGKVFAIFTGLGILVACLGLFALATFMAEQRRHEIGVRRVLGASGRDIVLLLTRPFVLLVILAIVLALPLAWWATGQWLSGFAYHANISIWTFLSAGALALLLAVLTMSIQAIRAAALDPVETMR